MKVYYLGLFSIFLFTCQFKSTESKIPIPYDDYVKLFALQAIDDVRFEALKGKVRDSALVSSRQIHLANMGYTDSIFREGIKVYNNHSPEMQQKFMHDVDSTISLIQKLN